MERFRFDIQNMLTGQDVQLTSFREAVRMVNTNIDDVDSQTQFSVT